MIEQRTHKDPKEKKSALILAAIDRAMVRNTRTPVENLIRVATRTEDRKVLAAIVGHPAHRDPQVEATTIGFAIGALDDPTDVILTMERSSRNSTLDAAVARNPHTNTTTLQKLKSIAEETHNPALSKMIPAVILPDFQTTSRDIKIVKIKRLGGLLWEEKKEKAIQLNLNRKLL
jgi:hypothetical protein